MMVPIEKEALGDSSRRVEKIVQPLGGAGVASEMCAANDASKPNPGEQGACAFACRPLNSEARRHAKSRSNFHGHLIFRRQFKLSLRPGLQYWKTPWLAKKELKATIRSRRLCVSWIIAPKFVVCLSQHARAHTEFSPKKHGFFSFFRIQPVQSRPGVQAKPKSQKCRFSRLDPQIEKKIEFSRLNPNFKKKTNKTCRCTTSSKLRNSILELSYVTAWPQLLLRPQLQVGVLAITWHRSRVALNTLQHTKDVNKTVVVQQFPN